MTITNPAPPPMASASSQPEDTGAYRVRNRFDETKASFKTTELWATIVGVVALIVVYNASDDPSLNLWRTCLLAIIMGAAYVVSRGIAKSGSSHNDYDYDRNEGHGQR